MCIQFHPINSIESAVPKTRKRVFHIRDQYEIIFENSAQSDSLFVAKSDFGAEFIDKVIKVNISAIF